MGRQGSRALGFGPEPETATIAAWPSLLRSPTARRCGPRCGGPCTWRSTPRHTCSRTGSACSSSRPTTAWRERPDMDPVGTRGLPGRDRRPRPVRRGPRRRASRRRRHPVRHPRCRSRHPRRAPTGPRRPPADLRGRPARAPRPGSVAAWSSSASTSPTGCTSCRSTSRAGRAGGTGCAPPASTPQRPAVVASTGVSMYLSKDTTAATLRQLAALAPGSTVAMTFLLPIELVDDRRPGRARDEHPRRPRLGHAVRQLLHARTRSWRWPGRPASSTPGTCPARAGRALLRRPTRRRSGPPAARTSSSPRPDTRLPGRPCWRPAGEVDGWIPQVSDAALSVPATRRSLRRRWLVVAGLAVLAGALLITAANQQRAGPHRAALQRTGVTADGTVISVDARPVGRGRFPYGSLVVRFDAAGQLQEQPVAVGRRGGRVRGRPARARRLRRGRPFTGRARECHLTALGHPRRPRLRRRPPGRHHHADRRTPRPPHRKGRASRAVASAAVTHRPGPAGDRSAAGAHGRSWCSRHRPGR